MKRLQLSWENTWMNFEEDNKIVIILHGDGFFQPWRGCGDNIIIDSLPGDHCTTKCRNVGTWKSRWTRRGIESEPMTSSATLNGQEVGGGGHALPSPAKCRHSNGKKIRHVWGTAGIEMRPAALFATLTVTFAGRKPSESLSESFKMRTLSDFVGERIPHAFCRCRGQIRVQVTVVGRHCVCGVCGRGGDGDVVTAMTHQAARSLWRHWTPTNHVPYVSAGQ